MTPYANPVSLMAENAGCDRAGAPVARGVCFTLSPGEGLQLFGPNGSGKTSLLSLFAGLIDLAEGAISWRTGDDENAKPPQDSVFFLGHDASVKLAMTAEENLRFWASFYGVEKSQRAQRIVKALAAVDANAFRHLRAGVLSAGQKRRTDLARALLADRPVWLLDEPAAALDRDGVKMIRSLIDGHLARGGVAIVATHDDLGSGFKRVELGR